LADPIGIAVLWFYNPWTGSPPQGWCGLRSQGQGDPAAGRNPAPRFAPGVGRGHRQEARRLGSGQAAVPRRHLFPEGHRPGVRSPWCQANT